MARKPRIHFLMALYHVISRGNQHQDIFLDDQDRTVYLSYLSQSKARYFIELCAYALMRNHVLCWAQHKTWLSRSAQAWTLRSSSLHKAPNRVRKSSRSSSLRKMEGPSIPRPITWCKAQGASSLAYLGMSPLLYPSIPHVQHYFSLHPHISLYRKEECQGA